VAFVARSRQYKGPDVSLTVTVVALVSSMGVCWVAVAAVT